MVNCRELLGSLEMTALLSGLCQPGPLGRLNKVFLACDTAEGCIIEEDGDIGAEGGREEVEGLQ